MASYFYYDQPHYYPSYYGDVRPYYEAPVTFQQEPAYFDGYRRDYRRSSSYDGRHGLIPVEEVNRRGHPPWWFDDNFPHGGRDGYRIPYHERRHERRYTTVELYVPICCDKCERKVKKHLNDIEGVERVTADQWTKKVVVVGYVRPDFVLRRAQRDKSESEYWSDYHHRS